MFSIYRRLKAISPFRDSFFIKVDYGCGFVTFRGELEEFFTKFIKEKKGWKTYDCDKYLVVLPVPKTKEIEVIWLSSSVNPDGPRPAEG